MWLDTLPSDVRAVRTHALASLLESTRGLRFDAATHTYMLDDRPLDSVSSVVERFTRFQPEETARRVAANPKHELYGHPIEEILELWRAKAQAAASLGTSVHEYAEGQYLLHTGLKEESEEPQSGKQAAVREWWNRLDTSRLIPVAKETQIANPELGYAGTFDLLLYDMQRKTFCLRDWKTNADIHRWFGQKMRPPFDHLKDNALGHYTLQQSLYALQLANIGIPVEDMQLVWLLDDGTWQEIPLENCAKLAHHFLSGKVPGDNVN